MLVGARVAANGDVFGLASRQCFLFGPGVEPPRLTADCTKPHGTATALQLSVGALDS